MSTASVLQAQVRAMGDSIDMCDCKLGRTIIMAERDKLIEQMRSAMGRELARHNRSYQGRFI